MQPVARIRSHYNAFDMKFNGTFASWATYELWLAERCVARGLPAQRLWPHCGIDGLFAGLYASQIRHWLRFFSPSQAR